MRPPRRISDLPPWVVVALAAVVFLGTLAVMSAIAGWNEVVDELRPNLSYWFAVAFGAEVLSFAAYVFAYRGIAHIENGPRLSLRESTELVAVGFGAFLAKGGAAVDAKALSSGRGGREGEIRVLALDALEHAPLAPAACAASIALLVQGKREPPLDFTIPWATLVPLGAVLAFVGVRNRRRFLDREGWRGHLGRILTGIHILFRLACQWRRHWPAFAGATVYWAGDVLCLWAALKPFGPSPAIPPVILAHAVGYVLTRRTLPLAGAGVVEVLMPLTLVAAGASFPGAVLGVITYRIFNLWLPLLPAALALRRARRTLRRGARARTA
ncbi:MAG TPA: lysylphosphatidylglycerol synthase domain-containing protein [Gaiellaceae bacterium]|nr:lysylphosphatidylglycerol synthase domain-containing protein [Gaiellaceae bacterium]